MTDINPNRQRISSDFALEKIILILLMLTFSFFFYVNIYDHTLTLSTGSGMLAGIIALGVVYYFVNRSNIIEYDDIKQVLYVLDHKHENEIEIPLEKIEKIYLSMAGDFFVKYSYVIVYRDAHDNRNKQRLHPIFMNHCVDDMIRDAKLKNPDLVVKKWSFGWNELFE